MSLSDLNSAGLLILSPRQEVSPPIRLEVTYTPAEEVVQLRSRVKELELDLLKKTQDYKQLEFKYCMQINLQMQLGDWARENKVKIPSRFLQMI